MGRRTHFNSRPHEEVDLYGVKIACVYVISTHDLTRRSTRFAPFACENVRNISTHDLTRRSTSLKNCTASNTLFQLTTSRGGRPLRHNPGPKFLSISTHDLTRRSTGRNRSRSRKEIFQLTTSQGGRLHRLSDRLLLHYFNSRPRKEVDKPRLGRTISSD